MVSSLMAAKVIRGNAKYCVLCSCRLQGRVCLHDFSHPRLLAHSFLHYHNAFLLHSVLSLPHLPFPTLTPSILQEPYNLPRHHHKVKDHCSIFFFFLRCQLVSILRAPLAMFHNSGFNGFTGKHRLLSSAKQKGKGLPN